LSFAYTKSSIINAFLEYFLGFNLCFYSKEIIENNLGLENVNSWCRPSLHCEAPV
jgi:hypothetical protein